MEDLFLCKKFFLEKEPSGNIFINIDFNLLQKFNLTKYGFKIFKKHQNEKIFVNLIF